MKNHPFGVDAHFQDSLVLTYALPAQQLQSFIPECLKLDTFQDYWAFLAVAVVRTKDLRPHSFPTFLGHDFTLIGYRIFVQYVTNQGKRFRGLYILKSDTDKKLMQWLGNLFTHYHYDTIDINYERLNDRITIHSSQSKLTIQVKTNATNPNLPIHSPFANWKEARRFAGPLPFTFSYNQPKQEVLIVQGDREHWIPQPVEIVEATIDFLQQDTYKGIVPACAFLIENIDYHWQKGRIESWKR